MTALAWLFLALAVAGVTFGMGRWALERRTLRRLHRMLDRAIAGGFTEDQFDESALSALEGKLARFLRGSASAQRTLAEEQAAVKSLIADIAHQTRTPIANLLLYASLLAESELSPVQREQLQALTAQGEKLAFLAAALVKASRLEAGIVAPAPAPHPVGPLLAEAAKQAEQAAGEKEIALTVGAYDGQAVFDPRWTAEALCNLVDNAVKYTPAGGAVTLSARTLDSFCRIDVTDTGPGIPEAEQGAIFNRFYRGREVRAAEGLGLGLYLAREIVQRQGGYIKAASRPGEGCTFSLYLPREP